MISEKGITLLSVGARAKSQKEQWWQYSGKIFRLIVGRWSHVLSKNGNSTVIH
jgi:hypothetical protein